MSVILTNYLTMSGSFEHCVLFASLPTFTVNPNYEGNKYSFSGRCKHSSQLWESAWDAKGRQPGAVHQLVLVPKLVLCASTSTH